MKKFFLFLFIPLFSNSQSIQLKIETAEQKLSDLHKKETEILSELEEYKFQMIHMDLEKIGFPKTETCDQIIFHSAYALVYDEKYEQAKWVAHIILPDVKNGNEGRSNDFRPDDKIATGSAVESDYFIKTMNPDSSWNYDGFGYDRGHLAPSADFRYSKKALSESFYYSNMSPQVAELNRGCWANMEDLLRQYAVRNNTPLYVVTGGVLKPELKKIERGTNKVSIPEKYFKVALDMSNHRAIAFLFPNKACEFDLSHYVCSIDSIENVTGLDFYYKLEDEEETGLEKQVAFSPWLNVRDTGDIEPMDATTLPKNTFNTTQAAIYSGRNEAITVCGTVVGTKLSSKGNIFLNLDKKFPNQIFTVTIFKDNVVNFSYQPEIYLEGKTICVKGKVTDSNGTPGIIVENEKAIKISE